MSVLLVEEVGPVLVLTMNRPEVRNAVDLELADLIAESLDRLEARQDLRVAILCGAGGTFSAGMDLKAFSEGQIPSWPDRGFAGIVRRPPTKPIIAAVEGYALGGGFEVALACDLIVASETAKFGLPEVQRGVTAAGGGLLRLQERVPYHFAMEMILTGRSISASEASEVHLVSRLSRSGHAKADALALATEIAENAPLAVVAAKRVMIESRDWTRESQFETQERYLGPVRLSSDAKEGALAFVERRTASWTGT